MSHFTDRIFRKINKIKGGDKVERLNKKGNVEPMFCVFYDKCTAYDEDSCLFWDSCSGVDTGWCVFHDTCGID